MKPFRYTCISLAFILAIASVRAQVSFKTIVPQHTVSVNESFQVQYVIDNAKEIANFSPPSFPGFTVVTGPNAYSDNKTHSRKNLVMTLVPTREGKLKIAGARCMIDGKLLTSDDVFVKVGSPRDRDESSYFLKPGEDPYKKISENLFLKLIIDKQNCFIGEPLVATFKLYSRLQSKSNVIKNPGFYGFSVYDMIDVNDRVQSEEKLNGHVYDVHTIRKMQLYPLEAGNFTIDAMELANQVEFAPADAGKKPDQTTVTENMYNKRDSSENSPNVKVYETNIKSQPVSIHVKPLPGKNVVDTFEGAVGNFSINAFVAKDTVLRNQDDSLVIEINGVGNFQRVNAPVINWPASFEAFEPSVKDTFDKSQVPLAGQRRFRYVFVSNQPGIYTIPPISFSFFNLRSESYKTVFTRPFQIFISAKSRNYQPTESPEATKISRIDRKWVLILSGLLVLAIVITGITWAVLRRKANRIAVAPGPLVPARQFLPIPEILEPAREAMGGSDKGFFDMLGRCIWSYFNDRFDIFNAPMVKKELAGMLLARGVRQELVIRQLEILHQCETGIYTNAEMNLNKQELFDISKETLEAMEETIRNGQNPNSK